MESPMKKSLRIALVVVVLASLASIAMAAPGGTVPPPRHFNFSALTVVVVAVLSFLGL
jgi:hypothetical protein